MTPELINSLKTFTNFTQRSYGFYVEKNGQKVRKTFEFDEKDINIERICLAIDEVKHMKKRKPLIKDIKHLNSITSERTNLYREIIAI